MEEEPKSVQIDGQGGGGDEFYEEIEAPKFVDFTTPDHFCPDDRYWFCMRVGCDQKHEEELDPEAIYKNFVLRVMAARSPNVKLRKALNRKSPSLKCPLTAPAKSSKPRVSNVKLQKALNRKSPSLKCPLTAPAKSSKPRVSNVKLRKALNRKSPSLKCPLTAPAKSSKPRVSRLALISSISQKIVDANDKARPFRTKITATTPNVKAKQPSSVAKALTTPRNRKTISNPDTFQSVRNPKPKDVVVPKNRVVAKALVFHSPKKVVKTKISLECGNNVGKLCTAMKKMDIASGKKLVSGYSKPLPLETPRKPFRGREVKSRVFDSLHSTKGKGREAKSLKRKKREKDFSQCCDKVPYEAVDNDSSDMEVDEKLRNGSLEGFSKSVTCKSGDEECLEGGKTSESSLDENQVEVVSETSKPEISSSSSSEVNDLEENGSLQKSDNRNGHEDKPKLSSGMWKTLEHIKDDDKENVVASDMDHDNEMMHTHDKENRMTSEDKRAQKLNSHSKRKKLGNHSASKNSKKVIQVAEKIPKENSTSAPTSAQAVKYGRPIPTNPKPFRFRTDERGMLKEANLEKKVHAPLKEITLETLPENSRNNHQNMIQTNKICLGQSEYESDSQSCEKKRTRVDQNGKMGATCQQERNLSEMTPPRRSNVLTAEKPHKEKTKSPMVQPVLNAKKPHKEKTKSPMVQSVLNAKKPHKERTKSPMPNFARPRVDSSKKTAVSSQTPCQLSVIKESVSTNTRPRKAAKPFGVSSASKARIPSKSSSRGRRPATIPKEPHFHTIHVPKSCTKLQKEMDLTDA